MKFAILGAGAVAGYFGARLDAAGANVTYIARGAHLEAIRSGGLRIESANGDLHIDPAKATDDPGEIGPVDYVIFAVKLFDTEVSGAMAKPLLGFVASKSPTPPATTTPELCLDCRSPWCLCVFVAILALAAPRVPNRIDYVPRID